MTPLEKKLVARLLSMASDVFSEHGCNDFDLVGDAGLTPDESLSIQQALHSWQDDPFAPPPSADQHYVMDWMLMRMLADRLKAPKEEL